MTNEDLVIKLTAHDTRLDTAEKRLDKLETAQKELNELNNSFTTLNSTLDSTIKNMDVLNTRIREIELAPGKKFEKIKIIILTAALTAVIGGLISALLTLV